jgi:rhamnogalacturonan endolyase
MLYVNSGGDPQALYEDAKAQAQKQMAQWPFDWVNTPDYAKKADRVAVSGHIVLKDPLAPEKPSLTHYHVGLTHAAWTSPAAGPGGAGGGRQIDWQQDAKFYQYWTLATPDGTFTIPNVRPGTYTLHAFVDGVLGELTQADVKIEPGKAADLGSISWTPVRHGKQLWDIGIPNRNGSEFFMADKYTQLDISLQYPKLFPDDLTYTIGKSDFRKDWFFQHVPHNVDPEARAAPFFGIRGQPGHATPYTVVFDMADAPPAGGKATLRLAICGGGARSLMVAVNGQEAGEVSRLIGDGVLTRHQIQGIWYEREVPFDASLLQKGTNRLVITVPEGPVNNGVIYDYLRLELEDGKQ